MKKGFFVIVLLIVLSTWVEAQVFSVKKFVRIEFPVQAFQSNWIQSVPGEGGCISYTANPKTPGAQSLNLFGADGITQQLFVNAGQVVFVCGDVAHIPPRFN
jgi:hypothetical protein